MPLAASADEPPAVPLPAGVKAEWDLSKAVSDQTDTRERICLNGLWRWQLADGASEEVPKGQWGYFKVPGCWPGIGDYMQKDCQTVFAHPAWKDRKLGGVTAAWYQREFTVPPKWEGRQIITQLDCLNSYAAIFVDGKKVGEVHFPAGEVDLTAACQPGTKHVLSMLVIAMPLRGVMLSYTDSAHAREMKGSVRRRGLCGDVWLASRPPGPRIASVTVETSTRRGEITFVAALENLTPDAHYALWARVTRNGQTALEPASPAFQARDLQGGRYRFTAKWTPPEYWDLHTPGNLYDAQLTLREAPNGKVLDAQIPIRFGFREFWIEGRDFFLNGTPIHLSAVPLDNAQISADLASYAATKETLQRLKGIGINFVYTHHYDCEPGSHLALEEILRAADDVGMLVSITQPHFSHYDWKAADADEKNGYAAHAAYYAQVAGSHPSVVAYAMSHNATGYEEDMNPDLIDGIHDPRDNWSSKNAKLALRAEAIVQRFDASRIVYHHASGNLGSMHAINFYPNFVPIQELSDWFEHWATAGVKPVFLCEYGAPFTWDWTMYRGWYQGKREFGSANVPWEFCLAEWNALFLGDAAYRISDAEKANLRWEAKQFRTAQGWHRWDYPNQVGSDRFTERYPVFAKYITDNWRAFRTWGVSAISPWEYEHYWKLRDGVQRGREELPVDWDHLQRPGFSADYRDQRMERMDVAFERKDWIATPAAEALLRNNLPLLGYIAGKQDAFTSKDHLFIPGDRLEKQLIVINNSREPVTCEASWTTEGASGSAQLQIPPGQQKHNVFSFEIPLTLGKGRHVIEAEFKFSTGEVQTDEFAFEVLPRLAPVAAGKGKIALWDPKGETRTLLADLRVRTTDVTPTTDLTPFDGLVVGKGALTATGAAPSLARVREGMNVLIFEQTSEALEKRFGFRVAEYGLRQVFPRTDLTLLAAFSPELLRDWRGSATLLPPRLSYNLQPRYGPTVTWAGLTVPHLWRCGNRGNVASVTIEKPACGDFLSLLEGGYGLHYSALLRYREGDGQIFFCQMDVTGRTENDPVADALVKRLLTAAALHTSPPHRNTFYLGEAAGLAHLQAAGIAAKPFLARDATAHDLLVLGPGSPPKDPAEAAKIKEWVKQGGHVLAVGLEQAEAEALLPFPVKMQPGEYIEGALGDGELPAVFRGIGPAELYNRDPRKLPLVAEGARTFARGVLAVSKDESVVFCQFVPWQFDAVAPANCKRTHRQASILLSRLLANLGAVSTPPVLERFQKPAVNAEGGRWLTGFYLDQADEWDDPYRHFRW